MTDTPKTLSATGDALLTAAAERDDQLIRLPKLPVAAARQVVRSLLLAELAEEVPAPFDDAAFAWRRDAEDVVLMLRATAQGLSRAGKSRDGAAAIGPASLDDAAGTAEATETTPAVAYHVDPLPVTTSTPEPARDELALSATGMHEPAAVSLVADVQGSPLRQGPGARRGNLREAAQTLLAAWDGLPDADRVATAAISAPVDGLRAALALFTKTPAQADAQHPPRDTKQAAVLAMLRRNEGASGPQIAAAMGWAPHTVRGFLAGLAKKGITVGVLDRVR